MRNRRNRLLLTTGLSVLAAAAVLAGCSGDKLPSDPGARAYVELDCGRCHGDEREGKRTAPPLTGLDSLWNAEGLRAYLQNPKEVAAATPHMAYRNEQYTIIMPKYAHLDNQTLDALVQFLLTG